MVMSYRFAYRLGMRPWEDYKVAAATHIEAMLDRALAEAGQPGRALDLGCGRGTYAADLVARGWEVVGVDNVPQAIEAARGLGLAGAEFRLLDVTALEAAGLGEFDLFLDIGCFQGLDPAQRAAQGRGVTSLARPGASMLLLQFQPTWLRRVAGGVSPDEVTAAFPEWDLAMVEEAQTDGLGWPLSLTRPLWYRFVRRP